MPRSHAEVRAHHEEAPEVPRKVLRLRRVRNVSVQRPVHLLDVADVPGPQLFFWVSHRLVQLLRWEELLIAPVSGAEEPGAFAGVLEEVSGRSASSLQKTQKGRRRAPGPKARQN